jgi:cobalt-zinc-cadmium efflux system protein
MAEHHSHAHAQAGAAPSSDERRRVLRIALGLNGGFFAFELVGGIAFGSLALLADAAHMLSDVAALAIALVAAAIALRPASARNTYGLVRAEILAAQLNALLLIGSAIWIAVEAWRRVGDDASINGGGVVAVALVGLLINASSAAILARGAGHDLNMRGAFWHMASDALGSVAALGSGVAVVVWDAAWVDLAASVIIAALVCVGGWRLLAEATRVLLEAAPHHVDVDGVTRSICSADGVASVHHVHLWTIGSGTTALSAHVVFDGAASIHDAQVQSEVIKQRLAHDHGITHATLELECHTCEPSTNEMQCQ